MVARKTQSGGVGGPGRPWSARLVACFCLLLVLAVGSIVSFELLGTRRDAWQRATDGAQNLVRAVENDLSSDIKLIDITLRPIADMLLQEEEFGGHLPFSPRVLRERIDAARFLGDLLLLDSAGNVIFDARGGATGLSGPPPGFADHEVFTFHRDRPEGGLHVSRPYRSRLAGHALSIGFSRRLPRPDGSFAGVVLGEVRLDTLKSLFQGMELGERGSMTLVHKDGHILMRKPFDERQIGQDISSGSPFKQMMASPVGQFVSVAALDGVERVYSHRHIEGVPLIVNVALSVDEIYAAWRHKAIIVGLVTLLLTGATVGTMLLMLKQLERRRQAEHDAWESEATFRLLAENSSDMVCRLNLEGVRLYVSPASKTIFGRTPEEMVGRRSLDDVYPEDLPLVMDAVLRLHRGEASVTSTYRIVNREGRPVWVEVTLKTYFDRDTGEPDGAVAVVRDISERKAAEEALAAAARTDGLTGLANRRAFDEALEREWSRARREGEPLSLLMLDADRFKLFNDTYGHPAGDECLRRMAAAVGGAIRRPADVAARYGGEELAVLLPRTDEAGAAAVAEQIRADIEAIGLAHAHNQPAGVVTVSIGVATVVPPSDGSVETAALVAAADAALYAAKHGGRNRVAAAGAVPPPPEPAPLPADENDRLAALARYEEAGLVVPGDEELNQISSLAARLLGTPVGLVTLLGKERQIFAGRSGLDLDGTTRDVAFCAHLVASEDDALVVPDTAADPRFAGNPLVVGSPGIRFYAGVPLICASTGQRLGALCTMDCVARPSLDAEQAALLRHLAALVSNSLAHRAAAGMVAQPSLTPSVPLEPIVEPVSVGGHQADRGAGEMDRQEQRVAARDR